MEQAYLLQLAEAVCLTRGPYGSLESCPTGVRIQDDPRHRHPRELSHRVTGPRSMASWRRFLTFSPPLCPGSFWDETSVSFLRLEKEAFGGVPLPIVSEPSRSSDEDCSARGFAGLKKAWLKLECDAMTSPDA